MNIKFYKICVLLVFAASLLVCTAIFMKLYLHYKGKYNIINNEADFNNQNFIENRIIPTKHQNTRYIRHLFPFFFT